MYKEKLKDYESPTVDLLKIKFEGIICGSEYGDPGDAGKGFDAGDNINDYPDWF